MIILVTVYQGIHMIVQFQTVLLKVHGVSMLLIGCTPGHTVLIVTVGHLITEAVGLTMLTHILIAMGYIVPLLLHMVMQSFGLMEVEPPHTVRQISQGREIIEKIVSLDNESRNCYEKATSTSEKIDILFGKNFRKRKEN